MKQGEEYIVEKKDRHERPFVFKIIILEATKTTVYFQIEDGDRKRSLTGDFEKNYRIIEKIEKEKKTSAKVSEEDFDFLQKLYIFLRYHTEGISQTTLLEFEKLTEKLNIELYGSTNDLQQIRKEDS
jgi:hypothetical protein